MEDAQDRKRGRPKGAKGKPKTTVQLLAIHLRKINMKAKKGDMDAKQELESWIKIARSA